MNESGELNKDMGSYYRDRAKEYDKNAYDPDKRPEIQHDIQETTRILQEALAGKNVLEIAAGPGFWTQRIAATAKSITATDINQAVLDEAAKKQYPEGKVSFRAADLYALGDTSPHDGLFGGFIFSHILKQDYDKFLRAIESYVCPGGTIVLIDNNKKFNPQQQDRVDEQGNNYRMRTLEDGSKHEIPKNYPTEEELRQLLVNRAAGVDFRNLEYYWILIYHTPTA